MVDEGRERRRVAAWMALVHLPARALVLDDVDAAYALAEAFATGRWMGLPHPQVPRCAARWYERAARRGHRDAQYELGFTFLLGEGVEPSIEWGVVWMTRAAEAEHPEAMRVLVDGYGSGTLGIAPDARLASLWSERLAAHLDSHPEHRRSYER